jgi:putative ABC transport system ATP-binding protein
VTESVVEVRGLRFAYPGGPPLLAVDSFDVVGPGLVAVVGQSGAGKSTFGALIGGQEQAPYEGSIRVLGREWSALSRRRQDDERQRHRRRIGYIPQGYGLLAHFTPLEMLMLDMGDAGIPEAERGDRARRALRAMGLTDMRDRPIAELSGGQQQRVAIARMLARDVGLVVADEPTANLDPDTTRDVMVALGQAAEAVPVIVITHDRWVADQCQWRLELSAAQEGRQPAVHGPRRLLALSSAAAGHLEMWRADGDGPVRHRWWSDEDEWSEWWDMRLPRRARAAAISASSRGPWDHELLVSDFDGKLWCCDWRTDAWSEWEQVPFEGAARTVALSSAGPGELERWVVDRAGRLWHQWIEGGTWSDWSEMPLDAGSALLTSVAACPRVGGPYELVASDSHGRAWHRWRTGDGWSDWHRLPVEGVRGVDISSARPGHLEIWAVHADGTIRHSWSGQDGRWSAWHGQVLPEGLRATSVAAGSRGDGHHELMARSSDGQVFHRWWGETGWSQWARA